MSELYVNVGGTWKTASNYYVNVNGTWKEGSELHAKVSSAWKESSSSSGGTYNGTSGIVTTNIVLDLNASNTSSYGGSGTTWTDISGNSNNATLVNSPTYSSSNRGYLSFDGSNDHATLPAIDLSGNELTFSLWTYSTSSGQSSLIFLGDSTATQKGRIINIHLPYGLNYYFDKGFDGSAYDRMTGSLQSSDHLNQWVNWTFTANASTGSMKIYRNGSSFATSTGHTRTFTNANGDIRVLAKRGSDSVYYQGFISQILLYKKELSASEVLQNYNATKSNYFGDIITTNLVVYLDAGKYNSYTGGGNNWTDISGNSNNFTLTNSPTFDSDFGGIITLDGTNDYAISATDASFMDFGTGDYSFGVWLRQSSFGTGEAVISSEADNGTNTDGSWVLDNLNGYNFFTNASGNYYRHSIRGSSSSTTLTTGRTAKAVDTWYYVVWVADRTANTGKLYVNGVLDITESSYTSVDVDNKYLRIGGGNTHGSLDADIGQVHIYKGKALSASEVLSNYNATKDTYGYATVSDPSGIIATGLDILLDAGNSNSYSGSGTTWTNLAPSSSPFSNATLSSASGTNTYSSNNSGYFDECRAFVPITGSTYVTSGSTITYPTMTYSVWCYPDSLGGYQTLIDQGNDQWFFGFNGTALITYNPNTGTTAGAAANNNWYNFTMTHTQNDVVKFYINGMKIKESGSTYNTAPTFYNWSFGAGSVSATSAGNEAFNGYIAAIAVYNRALSATEVMQNHNALKSRFGL